MKIEVAKVDIENEMDIVLAYRRAMQVSKFAGINISEQTRFATAVSEICRNTLDFCKGGKIVFSMLQQPDTSYELDGMVTDGGPGIVDLQSILQRNPQSHIGKGRGIVFSKKLVDKFKITSSKSGTHVNLGMKIPVAGNPINNLIIQGWVNHIKKEPAMSAYEELKIRNVGLMQLTDELKSEQLKNEKQIAEINELNKKLQGTNNYLEEFTYTVSHDLKTPLTTLKLSLKFLEETEDPASKITYIQIIERSAKRLEKTVQGLVEILDIQTKQQSLIKKITLNEAFNDAVDEFKPLIGNRVVRYTQSFMVEDISYIAPYITSIFSNLISNAIKYSETKKPLAINVESRRKSGMVVLTFKDNGDGMDLSKYGQRMFSPFVRFTNKQDGKGIGLYIIKKMIEKNGGTIEVKSEPGKGTQFTLYLKEYQTVLPS